MTSRDFAFWLQGLFELAEPETLDEKQTELIKRHLALVFIHEIDPSHSNDPRVQALLQEVHDNPAAIDGPGIPPDADFPQQPFNVPHSRPSGGGGTRFMC